MMSDCDEARELGTWKEAVAGLEAVASVASHALIIANRIISDTLNPFPHTHPRAPRHRSTPPPTCSHPPTHPPIAPARVLSEERSLLGAMSWKVAAVVLLALVAARVHDLSAKLGVFRTLTETDRSACSLLEHGPMGFGSEDIEFLPDGLAFISSGLRYPGMPNLNEDRAGGIFTVDVTAGDPRPSPLVIAGDPDADTLNPHGISLHVSHEGGDEVVRLFVVHHPTEDGTFQSRVKIYRYEPESRSLVHEHTIADPLLSSVNDVWAVGPDSFYATNDHALPWPLEILLGLRWTTVVFRASNGTVTVAATGFRSANGIAGSPDGRHVYVADLSSAELHVLSRSAGPELVPLQVVSLPSLPDNVAVDPATGDVWLACHPNAWKLFHLDPSNPPGTEVVRVENAAAPQPRVSQVLLVTDGTLQGGSVAARHGDHLLVGSVFHRTLHCRAGQLV